MVLIGVASLAACNYGPPVPTNGDPTAGGDPTANGGPTTDGDPTTWVKGVHVNSEPSSGDTYGIGETIRVAVRFTRPIAVTGTPRLALTIGTATRTVDMDFVNDDKLGVVFLYVTRAEDRDGDGIGIAADALTLNGGTIRDEYGNTADLDLGEHAIGNAADHKVDGSTVSPTRVRAVYINSEPSSGDTYGAGETIRVAVRFIRPIAVTGTPRLALTIGTATRTVDMDFVNDDKLGVVFRYVVRAEDRDGDGIGIAADALTLGGGTIRDEYGNAVDLDLGEHAIGNAADHKVDGST